MIHINQPATNYTYTLNGTFTPGTASSSTKSAGLAEYIGNGTPGSINAFFYASLFSASGGGSTASFAFFAASPTTMSLGTWVTSASIVVVVSGAQLVVSSDCAIQLVYTGVTVTVNGTLWLTFGGSTINVAPAGTYDEGTNCTRLTTDVNPGPGPSFVADAQGNPICGTLPFSMVEQATASGGYSYGTTDAVQIDNTSTGSCPCIMQPASITGTTSDGVSVTTFRSWILTYIDTGSQLCNCPIHPRQVTVNFWTQNYQIIVDNSAVSIKDSAVITGTNTLSTGWTCASTGNPDTSGSSTTNLTGTTCASSRAITLGVSDNFCTQYDATACPGAIKVCVTPVGPPGCLTCPPDTTCSYAETVSLAYTSKPPCIPTGTTRDLDMFQSSDGEYMQASTDNGNLTFSYSPVSQPPFAYTNVLTSSGTWRQPSLCQDAYGQIELRGTTVVAGVANTYRMWSNDHGQTFNPVVSGVLTPELVLANSVQCKVRASYDGDLMEITFVPDVGTAGVGSYSIRWKGSGDSAFGAPYVPTITGAGNLRGDGSGFGHDHANEGPNRWWISQVAEGDVLPTQWWSADQGHSWAAN